MSTPYKSSREYARLKSAANALAAEFDWRVAINACEEVMREIERDQWTSEGGR